MNASWSSSTVSGAIPSSRSTRRSAAVASTSLERVVGVLEHDAAPLADRLAADGRRERLEQPERVERARDPGGPVVDPGAREGVLEHRQVEGGVVRDEHGAVEQPEQLDGDLGEARREATSSSLIP